jgi:hypothetical protein
VQAERDLGWEWSCSEPQVKQHPVVLFWAWGDWERQGAEKRGARRRWGYRSPCSLDTTDKWMRDSRGSGGRAKTQLPPKPHCNIEVWKDFCMK